VGHRLRIFENRVLRKIFGPKREEDGSWRKLHNDAFHDLYSSQNIVRVIKSRKMRWADMWRAWGKARDYWEDLGLVGRITLRWTFGR
jgi:hypothetical protein